MENLWAVLTVHRFSMASASHGRFHRMRFLGLGMSGEPDRLAVAHSETTCRPVVTRRGSLAKPVVYAAGRRSFMVLSRSRRLRWDSIKVSLSYLAALVSSLYITLKRCRASERNDFTCGFGCPWWRSNCF